MNNRTAVYFFYDKDGIVDNYVLYFLNELKKIANRIVFVANGFINEECEENIKNITKEIIIRKNIGYDAHAYKEAFDYIGWEKLKDYDELIYCNSTFFGPVYSLENMFEQMNEKNDLDFWGITQHPDYLENKDDIPAFYINPYGYLPKHIQHYFVVYRKKFIKSKELFDYWKNLPKINNYFDSVGLFETVFTKHFEDLGFNWETYINYNGDLNYPLLYKPYDVVVKYKCPIIKRKSFFINNTLSNLNSTKDQSEKLLKYIENNNMYNIKLIYDNIRRTKNH